MRFLETIQREQREREIRQSAPNTPARTSTAQLTPFHRLLHKFQRTFHYSPLAPKRMLKHPLPSRYITAILRNIVSLLCSSMFRHRESAEIEPDAQDVYYFTPDQQHQCDQIAKGDRWGAPRITKARLNAPLPPIPSLPNLTTEQQDLMTWAATTARTRRRCASTPIYLAVIRAKPQPPRAEHVHANPRRRAFEYMARSHCAMLAVQIPPPRRSSLHVHYESLIENRWSWESALLSAGAGSFTEKVLRAVGDGGRDDTEAGHDGLLFLWQDFDARRGSRCVREPARSIEEVVEPEGFAVEV